ncbi:MAG: hypothetical protein U0T77_07480 [Chitinophagales bacterium]
MHIGFFNNIGYAFLMYLLTYVPGHIIFGFTSKDNKVSAQSEFIKIVLGTGSIIVFYSFYKTHLITINTGFLLIGLFYFWQQRPSLKPVFKINVRAVAVQLLLLTVIYTFLYFLLFGISERP